MTAVGWVITAGTVWFCCQFLAVLIGWRLAPLRGRAVVEWQEEEPKSGSETVAAEDQAIAVARASNDDHFALWEAELRERAR